jgi:nucleoside-diphosphate-sugar epimerase
MVAPARTPAESFTRRLHSGAMRVLVTGGFGFIGRATVGALAGAGHDVRVLDRDTAMVASAFRGSGIATPRSSRVKRLIG